jgi:hypothetical protein
VGPTANGLTAMSRMRPVRTAAPVMFVGCELHVQRGGRFKVLIHDAGIIRARSNSCSCRSLLRWVSRQSKFAVKLGSVKRTRFGLQKQRPRPWRTIPRIIVWGPPFRPQNGSTSRLPGQRPSVSHVPRRRLWLGCATT